MKWLSVALILILATASTALAHGHVSFGLNLGLPLFFYPSYPAYSYPAYVPPPPTRYYYSTPEDYSGPVGARTVVERTYVNGRLVEKRVKVYDDRPVAPSRRYEYYEDYGR